MLNEDISGRLPLKIDVIPAATVIFFLVSEYCYDMLFCFKLRTFVVWCPKADEQ